MLLNLCNTAIFIIMIRYFDFSGKGIVECSFNHVASRLKRWMFWGFMEFYLSSSLLTNQSVSECNNGECVEMHGKLFIIDLRHLKVIHLKITAQKPTYSISLVSLGTLIPCHSTASPCSIFFQLSNSTALLPLQPLFVCHQTQTSPSIVRTHCPVA